MSELPIGDTAGLPKALGHANEWQTIKLPADTRDADLSSRSPGSAHRSEPCNFVENAKSDIASANCFSCRVWLEAHGGRLLEFITGSSIGF